MNCFLIVIVAITLLPGTTIVKASPSGQPMPSGHTSHRAGTHANEKMLHQCLLVSPVRKSFTNFLPHFWFKYYRLISVLYVALSVLSGARGASRVVMAEIASLTRTCARLGMPLILGKTLVY